MLPPFASNLNSVSNVDVQIANMAATLCGKMQRSAYVVDDSF